MSEKVLREIKIIETDEGFRIEMTGDKEELRRMLFEQSRPFFAWGQRFGGHGPFGHHHHERDEQHEHHGHRPHEHDPREHMHPPFERRGEPTPEEMRNQHFFFRRFAGRGDWKAKHGGYDLGTWWDEGAPSDEQSM